MYQFSNGFTLFLSLLVEAVPFLLFGVLLSGLLLLFVDERKLISLLPQNPLLGALAGSMVGFLFPVCECGNVPVARRLLMQGASAPVAIGFLLAAPTINPIVIWATWTAFRGQPEIVVLRVVFSLVIATLIGWVFSAQADLRPLLQPGVAGSIPKPRAPSTGDEAKSLLQSGTFLLRESGKPQRMDASELQVALLASSSKQKPSSVRVSPQADDRKGNASLPEMASPWKNRLRLLLENTVQELRELGGVLVLGSLIAALIQVVAPRDVILSLGQGPVSSIVAMMILGAVVSICSTVDSFFALSFASTFTTGSLLAFLVFGPMVDLKGLGLMLTIFRARTVIYLLILTVQLTFLFTLFINLRIS